MDLLEYAVDVDVAYGLNPRNFAKHRLKSHNPLGDPPTLGWVYPFTVRLNPKILPKIFACGGLKSHIFVAYRSTRNTLNLFVTMPSGLEILIP